MTAYRKPVRMVVQRERWAKASWRYCTAAEANARLDGFRGTWPEPEGGPVVRCDLALRIGDEWRSLTPIIPHRTGQPGSQRPGRVVR